MPPPEGHGVASDPAFSIKYAEPAPKSRLVTVDEDLGRERRGWRIDWTTQGKGWTDRSSGWFDAELSIQGLKVPILDLYRAPHRRQYEPPSDEQIAKHMAYVSSGGEDLDDPFVMTYGGVPVLNLANGGLIG